MYLAVKIIFLNTPIIFLGLCMSLNITANIDVSWHQSKSIKIHQGEFKDEDMLLHRDYQTFLTQQFLIKTKYAPGKQAIEGNM